MDGTPTDELRRLVKAGYSDAEIARRFGLTPGAVREKCRRIGIRRTRHRTKSLTQDEALAELEMVAKVIRQRKELDQPSSPKPGASVVRSSPTQNLGA